MNITRMHKKATLVISVWETADHWVFCTVYQAGTVNGVRDWFGKKVGERVVTRHSTLRLQIVQAWINMFNEACNEGDCELIRMDDAAVEHIASVAPEYDRRVV